MSFSLSFSPEFFLAEGEPYDADVSDPACSVWSAIHAMSKEEWAEMARDVFDVDPAFLTPESVLDKIRETDTCSHLENPVPVWIDSEGNFVVHVHEAENG